MAWYTINYTCGHTDREQLYGPERDRQSKIAWMERNKACPSCYQAEVDRQRAAAHAQAKAESGGLPNLKGSDKQIAWAETIRAQAKRSIETAVGLYSKAAAERNEIPVGHPSVTEIADFAAKVLRQTEAKYWIDNRDKFASAEIVCPYLVKRAMEIKAAALGASLIAPAVIPPDSSKRIVKAQKLA